MKLKFMYLIYTECPRNKGANFKEEVMDITMIQICIGTHGRKRFPGG